MITLKRPKQIPAPMKSRRLHALQKAAATFFKDYSAASSQSRFDWSDTIRVLRGTTDTLLAMSHGKCAYCETIISARGAFNLEHFRPKGNAIDRDGKVERLHYWWLAFDWTNLLPACQACNVAKGTRFPVEGARAKFHEHGTRLGKERPLLLDPCIDDSNQHLIFDEDGHVSPASPRGKTTIEVLALNRESLVRARSQQIKLFRQLMQVLVAGPEKKRQMAAYVRKIAPSARAWLAPDQPFLAAKRQLLELWVHEAGGETLLKEVRKALGTRLPARKGKPAASRRKITTAKDKFQAQQQQGEKESVETTTPAASAAYFSGQRRIERIVLKNFKGVRDLTITLPEPTTIRQSWMMLVGENATGKSSILHAVALALIGQAHVGKMGLDARAFVTHDQPEGSVEVHLTNVSRPVRLTFNTREKRFTIDPPSELVLLLGYGATRLLPRSATTKSEMTRYVRVKNLFNPYARLQNAERWLTSEAVDETLFTQVAIALKQLLLLYEDARFFRERSRVKVQIGGEIHELRELSDGYQSVVALAVDIMMGLTPRWSSMDLAEGIVLIDELETHLHPRWKLEIVSRLRSVFPKLTFIATTHDPLCLRGLEPGEIVVLRKDGTEVIAQPVTESIAHLRADQLLTSELFGLSATRDPRITAKVTRHTELSSKPGRTPAEAKELATLGAELKDELVTAETPAGRTLERCLKELINEQILPIAQRQIQNPALMGTITDAARNALNALLQLADPLEKKVP